MAAIAQYRPVDLPNFVKTIQKLQTKAGSALWFRGATNSNHPLVPSLYRHPKIKTNADFEKLEHNVVTRFRQRSIPYHSRNLADDLEALFFMQHYGVPTRLLDWTENPLTALHFALMYATNKGKPKSAAIWILNPEKWNQAALAHLSYNGGPLTAGDDLLKGYARPDGSGGQGQYPVALFGAYNSPRIVAQQGVFTIFGRARDSMHSLVESGTFPKGVLSRIVVAPSRLTKFKTDLLNQGVTESVVFPDLEGLARETKRYFGFVKP